SQDRPVRRASAGWRWMLGAVVLAGVLVRGALLARVLVSSTIDDPDNYLPLARSLVEGRGFAINGRATAYRPPLYPLVLAPLIAIADARLAWGIAGLHLALGAGTVVLTAIAAKQWGMSPGRSLVAALIVACDPVLAAQSRM